MSRISGREAARCLSRHGLGLAACQALLATGIAGEGERVAGVDLFNEERVRALAAQAPLEREELPLLFPEGLMLLRLHRSRTIDAEAAWEEQRAILAGPWDLTRCDGYPGTTIERDPPPMPLVLLVSGFVVAGATVTGCVGHYATRRLHITPAGPWFERLRGRRVLGGRAAATVIRPSRPQAPLRPGQHLGHYGIVGRRGWDG